EPVSQSISARGEIQPDGSFRLGTHGDNDGALEGEYKVLVVPPPLPEEGKQRRSPVHPKYQNLESTPLKFTVTRDRDKNKFNIEVEYPESFPWKRPARSSRACDDGKLERGATGTS